MGLSFFKNGFVDEDLFRKETTGGDAIDSISTITSELDTFISSNGLINDNGVYKKQIESAEGCPKINDAQVYNGSVFVVTKVSAQTVINNICSIKVTWKYQEKVSITTMYNDYENLYRGSLKVDYQDLTARALIKLKEVIQKEPTVNNDQTRDAYINVIYSYRKEENITPIIPTLYGAFPSGIDASYCAILCNTDDQYYPQLQSLNEYANQYYQRLHPESTTNYLYFDEDSDGIYVLLNKEKTLDEDNELSRDWFRLYQYGLSSDELENQTVLVQNSEDEEPIECYKVYIKGTCQLVDLDGEGIVSTETEVAQFSLPNGYYVLINKQLYLFILTKVDRIDWDGTYDANNIEPLGDIKIYDRNLNYITKQLSERKDTDMPQNNKFYLYLGTQIDNDDILNGINHDNTRFMMQGAKNVRQFVMSSTITEVSGLGTNANPTNGYLFSDNLEYIGPHTIVSSGETTIYILSTPIVKIADDATDIINTNTKLFLCSNPIEMAKNPQSNGYIEIGPNTEYIGARAFNNIGADAVSFFSSDALTYVGKQAFAMHASCKQFYIRTDKLGNGINDLLYLPDEFYENGQYNSALFNNVVSACNYAGNNFPLAIERKTFGTNLSGYQMSTTIDD